MMPAWILGIVIPVAFVAGFVMCAFISINKDKDVK